MASKQQSKTNLPALVTWLHAGAEEIVYYSLRKVDGARLPYTRRMLDAGLSSSGSVVGILHLDTERKQLPKAS